MELTKNKQGNLSKKEQKNTGKETDNSEFLIERTEVKDSPFIIVSTEEGHFGSMGKWRITEVMDTVQGVKKDLEKITWNRLVQVVLLLIETQNEINK